MYHGLKFDPSGKCIQIPGQDNIPKSSACAATRWSRSEHLVWIWMGDPAQADPAKILDFPYLRDPDWRGKPDYMHYDANYLLIVDNLSDFAHLAFVHTKTLGGSEEYAYKSKPTAIERLDDGFRVERWHMDADAPPFHKKVVRDAGKVDRRNIARMYVPGIFFMETLFAPAGSGAEKGNLRGREAVPQLPVLHARDAPLDALLLGLPARLRPGRPDHRAQSLNDSMIDGLPRGQVHHRGPAADARRRPGVQDERHRRPMRRSRISAARSAS